VHSRSTRQTVNARSNSSVCLSRQGILLTAIYAKPPTEIAMKKYGHSSTTRLRSERDEYWAKPVRIEPHPQQLNMLDRYPHCQNKSVGSKKDLYRIDVWHFNCRQCALATVIFCSKVSDESLGDSRTGALRLIWGYLHIPRAFPQSDLAYSFVTSTIRVQVLLVKPVCKRLLRRYFPSLGSGGDACCQLACRQTRE
jgi:hypothetical protein